MGFTVHRIVLATLSIAPAIAASQPAPALDHLQGEMCGEVSATSVILQSRLTADKIVDGDVPGAAGFGRFELADNDRFDRSRHTPWIEAAADYDYIVKSYVDGLQPGTRYYYRLEFGSTKSQTRTGLTRSFRTLPAADADARMSFVVVTGMNYHKFHHGGERSPGAYAGRDKSLGYPALVAMRKLKPDFFVGTGDNVYYDTPRLGSATDAASMRKKWHEQFVQPRYVDLFAAVPTYWEKDDHDYRYDDCDNTTQRPPSPRLGHRIFREQVPIVDPTKPDAVTYRTFRAGKHLQFWFPEGRDYRSANLSPDGPEKTLWGLEQRRWLKRTLLESDATFKIIVSATPMIGPDDIHKKDNHTDEGGFQHEGRAFFHWAAEHGFLDKGLYFVCGDRHWQYHSIHPSGFEEFSSGALVDANSRLGMKPGDEKSTDPEAKIKQPYTSKVPSGGFLNVVVEPGSAAQPARLRFNFYDERGELLYQATKAGSPVER